MATRTKPLVTAATLASAAAIAVATPAISPSLSLPTPHALTAAKVQLATFADVLSIPAEEWTDLLFFNSTWGGVLRVDNYGDESAKPQDVFLQPGYVNPWAVYCTDGDGNGSCKRSGPTGAAYLFFDALVNGNGEGWDNVENWNTGIVNYFWEPNATFVIGGGNSPSLQYVSAGYSAATWYLLQTTIGKAIPALTIPIAVPFWGPDNLSVAYNAALSIVAGVLNTIPVVGPITGNSILAYLGDLPIPNTDPQLFYQYGLSGVLNYWIDIATGAVPFPSAATRAAAATLANATTAVAPAAAAATVTAPETPAVADDSKPAADVSDDNPKAEAPESTSEAEAPESTSEAEAPESTSEAEAPEAETPPVKAPESAPEAEAPEVETPAVTDTKPVAEATSVQAPAADTTPAKPARPHPVRDAVEKVGKQINSAINDAKAKQAEKVAARKAAKAGKSS